MVSAEDAWEATQRRNLEEDEGEFNEETAIAASVSNQSSFFKYIYIYGD